MQNNYKVITLCGSTRFRTEFERVQIELTLQGNIVVSVGLFGHSGDEDVWKDGVKEMLDDMHLAKIDMADEIYVINPGGYVGQSTAREIAYARCCGKPVRSICPLPTQGFGTKGILKVVVGEETREYIRKAARESGGTDDIAVENIVKEHIRHAKADQGIAHED